MKPCFKILITVNFQKTHHRTIGVTDRQVTEKYQLENKALSVQSASLEAVAFPEIFRKDTINSECE